MKIYRIISDNSDGKFLCYIGSTKREIKERIQSHEYEYKQFRNGFHNYVTSFELLKRNWYEIILIEDLGNCSKSYCLDKEAYYIDYYKKLSDEYLVVNKYNPNNFLNNSNYYQDYCKDYQQTEKFKEYRKQSNKYKEYQKQYHRQSNKYKEYQKQYRDKKKNELY